MAGGLAAGVQDQRSATGDLSMRPATGQQSWEPVTAGRQAGEPVMPGIQEADAEQKLVTTAAQLEQEVTAVAPELEAAVAQQEQSTTAALQELVSHWAAKWPRYWAADALGHWGAEYLEHWAVVRMKSWAAESQFRQEPWGPHLPLETPWYPVRVTRRLPSKGFKCPVCSKSVASSEMEVHFIMCLSKPRLSYNDDVLARDAGECVICLEELQQGDTIARLPCLCIYHKSCIDSWFEINRSCPEHPSD
ncbi:E3 ubiquitin-protein ligase znrf1 isoform X1 [Siniperca chuatsi]|uniref:E3 ubiquitin-protein ligase znrf1 isoform X1 n=1 Tax=Siniperca chuatsi TaxID=119488 RepID=UPI001CE1FA66|nr:E3 ubiquitin-protein ligase znrf1 isoform X1 [Siniperca chuatsi]